MAYKIVVELYVETEHPGAVAMFLQDWYGSPLNEHETENGVEFRVAGCLVVNEGFIDDGLQ